MTTTFLKGNIPKQFAPFWQQTGDRNVLQVGAL